MYYFTAHVSNKQEIALLRTTITKHFSLCKVIIRRKRNLEDRIITLHDQMKWLEFVKFSSAQYKIAWVPAYLSSSQDLEHTIYFTHTSNAELPWIPSLFSMAWKIEINQFHPEDIRKEIGREKYTSYRHSTSFNRVICHRKFACYNKRLFKCLFWKEWCYLPTY